jgi:hypothetical protein
MSTASSEEQLGTLLAPMLRAFTKGIGLSVLVLLFFAGRADAACFLRLNIDALSFPHKTAELTSRITFYGGASYTQTVGTACGLAFKPVEVSVTVTGAWNKRKRIARETVIVTVTPPFGQPAKYTGTTRVKCENDPWKNWVARCPNFVSAWSFLFGPYPFWVAGISKEDMAVEKLEAAVGWNTGAIVWKGFDYAGPYPAIRAKIFSNPWQEGYY